MNPELLTTLQAFEGSNANNHIPLENAYAISVSADKQTWNGNFLESTNIHGDLIRINTAKNPPERTLKLQGSNYMLEANENLGELKQPAIEFPAKLTQLENNARTLSLLQSPEVQGYISELKDH